MADETSPKPAKASKSNEPSPKSKGQESAGRNGKSNNNRSARARKRKRRFEPTEKLPTPPPEPRQEKTDSGERSAKRKSLDDKQNAFQQLDRLTSLLEQLLELRAKNARLFRRTRELERFKALKRLEASTKRTFLQGASEPMAPEEDVGFAESLLSAMLESSGTSSSSNQSAASQQVARAKSFRAPMARQRSRSIGTEAASPLVLPCNPAKRASCHLQYGSAAAALSRSAKRNSLASTLGLASIPPKVSKWTKVKAAFKWEKAGSGTSLGNLVVEALEQDAARFLKIPDAADVGNAATTNTTPSGSSTRTAEHSGPPSPATISSSSSIDDIYAGIQKRIHAARPTTRETEEDPTRRSRSLDGEIIIPQNIQYAQQHSRDSVVRRLDRGHKSAWGMVKDIIQSRRESVRRAQPRTSVRSEDGYSLSSHESSDMIHEIAATSDQSASSQVQVTVSESSLSVASPKPSSPGGNTSEIVDLASRRLTPTLTITLPSSEELRVSSPESCMSASPISHRQLDSTDERSPSEEQDYSASSPKPQTSRPTAASLGERRRFAGQNAVDRQPPQAPAPRLQRQDSKWNKVKRAFLTSASSVPPSPSRTSSFFDETDGGGSYSASAEDLDNNGGVSPSVQSDIQRNYQILHDKLSVEFNRKLAEWEKMKNSQSSGSTSRTSATSPKEKDSANALLMGEEQLTPEFKKKLQEWKRLKKTGNNPSGTTSPENQLFRRRLTDWQIWRTPAKSESKTPESEPGKTHLSEDFMKKMEEWKKIKSTRSDEEQSIAERRGSAELIQQARKISQRWKTLDEKEFQPLDRVIAMIEREQKMIGKRRDRLLDHKLRLNNLSRVLDSTPAKREVLVHTSTGYYKFEGISQEFTKKLYEWEKSQGIKPESSTLQLLHPAYKISATNKNAVSNHDTYPRSLKRSKSMSSVVESSQRDETPIRQPSSLSLNDATNLENGAKLRIDSKQTIADEEMSEELVLDDSEPEAVIVDIEDVIEETASPMAKFQPQQTPVYCVTASETTSIAIPLGTVTASHEPSPVILVQAGETHHRVRKHCRFSTSYDEHEESKNSLESHQEATPSVSRTNTSDSNDENRRRIFDANDINICETIIEEEVTSLHIGEESSPNAEMSSATQTTHNELIEPLQSTTKTINSIMNATKNSSNDDKSEKSAKRVENGSIAEPASLALSSIDSERKLFKTFINSANATKENGSNSFIDNVIPNCNSRETSNDIEIDDVVITVSSDVRPKKVLKTRRLTDTQVGYKWRQSSQQMEEKSPEPADELTVSTFPETPSVERIIINESTLGKIVVPTNSNEQLANIVPLNDASNNSQNATDVSEEEPYCRRITNKSESTSVFVKTKRMIFSPFSRRNAKDKDKDKTTATPSPQKPAVVEVVETKKVAEQPRPENQVPATSTPVNGSSTSPGVSQKILNIQRSRSSSECPIANERRPPLPQSPILARKDYRRSSPKETAPSIRMMIQRYNQKLQEESGSPASSGSGSPIWRSPTSERRVRNQMERYQEEVRRAIAGSSRYGLQERMRLEKSASAGLIQPSSLAMAPITAAMSANNSRNEILKSTSADFVRNPEGADRNSEADNDAAAAAGKRKNSLQNKNPEIFSNIKQSLVHESKTLPMRGDSSESQSRKSSMGGSESLLEQRSSGRISPDLMHKLNALTSAASQKLARFCDENQSTASENSTPCLGIRAQRVQQAKDDFMSRGPSCHSHDPSIDSSCRLSQADSSSSMEFVKSASAGMINVDPRTYERVQTNESRSGTLSKIASKFRRAKLRRAKDKDKDKDKMSTVSMLCRQSLLVDIQNGEMSKSCPTSPRDDDEHQSRFKQHRESN